MFAEEREDRENKDGVDVTDAIVDDNGVFMALECSGTDEGVGKTKAEDEVCERRTELDGEMSEDCDMNAEGDGEARTEDAGERVALEKMAEDIGETGVDDGAGVSDIEVP